MVRNRESTATGYSHEKEMRRVRAQEEKEMNLRRSYKGASALSYWWLRGHEPVSLEKAEQRASICLKCPKNEPESLFERPTRALAARYRAALESKHARNLHTSKDVHLKMCEACGCPLILKVWCPEEVIWHDGQPEGWDQMPDHCWIKIEANDRPIT